MNIASIDIGTNTVLMLIANINKDDKTIKPLLNEYKMPRIGKGLVPGGAISKERIEDLFQVLNKYSVLIGDYSCNKIIAKGTSALRLASNSQEIISAIRSKFGIDVEVISGKEEARLSYIGSISAASSDTFIVIDIGGGSTEIISGSRTEIKYSKSFNVGVVSLTERYIHHDPPKPRELTLMNNIIVNTFDELRDVLPRNAAVIAVAGTPTSLSCMKMGLKKYNEEKVEGSSLTRSQLQYFINELSLLSHTEIKEKYQQIVEGRDDIILTGTMILYNLTEILNSNEIIVSGRGIRYGSLVDYLNMPL